MKNRRRKPRVYIHPGTQFLWIRYYDERGKLVRVSARTTDWAEAERLLESRLQQVENRNNAHHELGGTKIRVHLYASTKIGDPKILSRREMSLVQRIDLADGHAVENFVQTVKRVVDDFIGRLSRPATRETDSGGRSIERQT